MQTIKTAVVVVLLLCVMYGAYVAINGSQTELPPELRKMLADDTELGIDVSVPGGSADAAKTKPGTGLTPSNGLASGPSSFWNTPSSTGASSTTVGSTPETLTPPKLTSIPSFPSTTPGSTSPTPFAPAPLKTDKPTGLTPTPNDLDLSDDDDKPEVSSPSSLTSIPPTAGGTTSTPSPFAVPSSLTPPGKPVTQSTPPSGLKMPENLSPPESMKDAGESVEPASPKKANLTGRSFDNAKKAALEKIDQNEFKAALATLSVFYNSPELTADQSQDLMNLLDSVAGETIYSRRHLLEQPYVVGPGETIETIAKKYEIPADLLAKINGVDPTLGPMPGTRLKVFQGPFRAEVDVKRNEMTLFLGELYAGRFPISTGTDPQPKEGVFQVLDKQRNRNYYGKGGLQIEAADPRNPYGGMWIDLGQDLSIHGSPNAQTGEGTGLGCISLSPQDAGDVFSMLSRGSQVTIKR